jgi:3-hydroxyacyl-CoA dehydrogenase
MFVHRAAVVGAGAMGAEIAQVIAAAGVPVFLGDPDEERRLEALDRVRGLTARGLDALVERGRLERDEADLRLDEVSGRVAHGADHRGLGAADIVIVTEPEDLDGLHELFGEIDAAAAGHAVLASSAPAVSVADVASATIRPDRVVGLNFFAPASSVRVVEVVEGEETSEETMQAAADFAARIGKQALRCLDGPGFAVHRVLMATLSEAWRAQHEEGLEPVELDARVVAGGFSSTGPFAIAARMGARRLLGVAEQLQGTLGPRFSVSPSLEELGRNGGDGR